MTSNLHHLCPTADRLSGWFLRRCEPQRRVHRQGVVADRPAPLALVPYAAVEDEISAKCWYLCVLAPSASRARLLLYIMMIPGKISATSTPPGGDGFPTRAPLWRELRPYVLLYESHPRQNHSIYVLSP